MEVRCDQEILTRPEMPFWSRLGGVPTGEQRPGAPASLFWEGVSHLRAEHCERSSTLRSFGVRTLAARTVRHKSAFIGALCTFREGIKTLKKGADYAITKRWWLR